MYRFLGEITAEDVEAIAAFAFMEMLERGFTAVGEFHYLHHQPDGTPMPTPRSMPSGSRQRRIQASRSRYCRFSTRMAALAGRPRMRGKGASSRISRASRA